MPGKVVDASVVAAVAFQESNVSEAKVLLKGADLYAPRLLAYELTSIARTKIARYPDQRENIVQLLESALASNVRWVEVNQITVLYLAVSSGLSTYDASYLYVANTLGMPLVTFDKRLAAAARMFGS